MTRGSLYLRFSPSGIVLPVKRALFAVVLVAADPGCSPEAPPATKLTQEQLEDPAICQGCHASQYTQWASSMHAYAADDPVFLAMNARGQRETNGALGSFCVQCHAPIALRLGLTTDGSNLASVPQWAKSVTCYFCHNTSAVTSTNDDPLVLANDGVMRAAIADPIAAAPHAGGYSLLHDGKVVASSQICGACHDVTNQHGIDVERTFAEWRASEFSHLLSSEDNTRACPSCHMPSSQGQAATQPLDSPVREIHDHSMPGIDLALVDFPDRAGQRALVQSFLDASVSAQLCVTGTDAAVTLQSENVGHAWPSGAIQDRRAWLELVAKTQGQVVFQSGVVADGDSISTLSDPNLWLLREQMLDGTNEVEFLWQALGIGTTTTLPYATGVSGTSAQHSVSRTYTLPANVDEVAIRLRIVPIDQAQLDLLVTSGDLAPAVRSAMSVMSVAKTTLTWVAGGPSCVN